jgi:hypothetical protein
MLPIKDKRIGNSQQDVPVFNRNIAVADYPIPVQNIDFVKKTNIFWGQATEYRGCRPQISDFGTEIPHPRTQLCVQDSKKLGLFDGMMGSANRMSRSSMAMLRSDLRRPRSGIGMKRTKLNNHFLKNRLCLNNLLQFPT